VAVRFLAYSESSNRRQDQAVVPTVAVLSCIPNWHSPENCILSWPMFRPQSCSWQRAGERSYRRGPTWNYSALVHPRSHLDLGNLPPAGDLSKHGSSLYPIRSDRAILPIQAIIQCPRWIRASTFSLVQRRGGQIAQAETNSETDVPGLRELGYEGSYDRVAAFGRQWKVGQTERGNSASKSTTFPPILRGGYMPQNNKSPLLSLRSLLRLIGEN